jgi:hypothetical protein
VEEGRGDGGERWCLGKDNKGEEVRRGGAHGQDGKEGARGGMWLARTRRVCGVGGRRGKG